MPSAVTNPQFIHKLQISWVGLALVIAVGVFSASLSGDLRSIQPGEGSNAEVAGLSNLDLDDKAPSDAHYAGVGVNLIEARPVPVNSSGRPIIVVNFEATNTTAFQLRLPKKQFTLIQTSESQDDGESITMQDTITPERFEYSEYSDRMVLEPGQTSEATAVFKLLPGANTDLEGWSLQIREPGRWPATIPLTGSVSPSEAIQPLVLADPAQSDAVTTYIESQISVLDTESSLDFGSYRAPLGKHLALFVIEVESTDGKSSVQLDDLVAEAKDEAFWQLSVGDEAAEATRVEVREESESSTTFVVVFTYPTGSTDLTLHANNGKLELTKLLIETL